MGVLGVVFALFTVGYILGVWTACFVLRQPQREYEEGALIRVAAPRAGILRGVSRVPAMRQ